MKKEKASLRGGVMELVRLPSLLPLLALFSGEECRVGVVRRLLEKLTTVEEVVEDKVTIGTAYPTQVPWWLFLRALYMWVREPDYLVPCTSSIIVIRCAGEPCQDSGWVSFSSDQPGTNFPNSSNLILVPTMCRTRNGRSPP